MGLAPWQLPKKVFSMFLILIPTTYGGPRVTTLHRQEYGTGVRIHSAVAINHKALIACLIHPEWVQGRAHTLTSES